MLACTSGYLPAVDLKIKEAYSTTVVAAAGGYPGKYKSGTPMSVSAPDADTYHFHAGTSFDPAAKELVTSGGRVICSTAIGSSIQAAVERAYKGVEKIRFDGMQYRRDIAHRALKPSSSSPTKITDDTPLTYASAGVDIYKGESLVQKIKPLVKMTARPGVGAVIGGFGGSVVLPKAGYGAGSPSILAAVDGVGTKLLIACAMEQYYEVGIDLVAMNVNDLVVSQNWSGSLHYAR